MFAVSILDNLVTPLAADTTDKQEELICDDARISGLRMAYSD